MRKLTSMGIVMATGMVILGGIQEAATQEQLRLPGLPEGPRLSDESGNVEVLSGLPQRTVVDLLVPGSPGKTPLQCTRHLMPVPTDAHIVHWHWGFEYFYRLYASSESNTNRYVTVLTPTEKLVDFAKVNATERITYNRNRLVWNGLNTQAPVLILNDGARVIFKKITPVSGEPFPPYYGGRLYVGEKIIDPQGLETSIENNSNLGPKKITDATGRWLDFKWEGQKLLEVTSSAGQKVVYDGHLNQNDLQGYNNLPFITSVKYTDGNFASYGFLSRAYAWNRVLNKMIDTRQKGAKMDLEFAWHDQIGDPTPDRVSAIKHYDSKAVITRVGRDDAARDRRAVVEELPNGGTRAYDVRLQSNSWPWWTPEETKTRDANSNTTSYFYNHPLSNVINRIVRPSGMEINMVYSYVAADLEHRHDNETYLVSASYGFAVKEIRYSGKDANGNAVSSVKKFIYTDDNNPYYVQESIDERNYSTKYEYHNGRILKKVVYPDATTEEWGDFDSYAQPKTHKLQSGAYEYWEYDSMGRKLKHWLPSFDGKKHSITYTYYPDGHAWEDRMKTMTDPNGTVTTYEYEYMQIPSPPYLKIPFSDQGLLSKEKFPDGTFKEFTYNKNGQVISVRNRNGETTLFAYDAYGRKTEETNPLGNKRKWDYSHDGNGPYAYVHGNPAKVIENSGKTTAFQYDAEFRMIKKTEAFGTLEASVHNYGYNSEDSVMSYSDPEGGDFIYTYDYRNRLEFSKQEYDYGSPSPSRYKVTQFVYDAAGNRTRVIHPDGQSESYTYDKLNRMVSYTNEENETTNYQYSKSGRLQLTIDPQGRKTGTNYDALNRPILKTVPNKDGGSKFFEAYWYDGNGNVQKRLDARNVWTSYKYDAFNNEISRCYSDNTPQVASEYDLAGRLKKTQSSQKALAYEYDGAGQQVKATHSVPGRYLQVVEYGYDGDGNRTFLRSEPHLNIDYKYNQKNRVWKVRRSASDLATYEYNKNGRVSIKTLGNGKRAEMRNLIGWPLAGITEPGVQSKTYDFDSRNRVSYLEDERYSETYFYSDKSELLDMNRMKNFGGSPYQEKSYDYDPSGNIKFKIELDNLNYTNNAANQNVSIAGHQNITLDYDAMGNRARKGAWSYTYDGDGMMNSATNGSYSSSYKYDPLGQIAIVKDGSSEYFPIYDGLNEILRLKSNGTFHESVVWGPGTNEPLFFKGPAGEHYFHLNHLNSVIAISNTSGEVKERYLYEPYGDFEVYDKDWIKKANSSFDPPVLFTGQRWVPEIGLYDFGARFYDQDLALWTSPDPVRQFHSLYSYGWNPISTMDPTGLYSMYQKEDGTFERVPDWMDMFSDNQANIDVTVMNAKTRSVFEKGGIQHLSTEWSDLASIALNHAGLFKLVGELSHTYEYGAAFNSGLEMIPHTDGKPATVHINSYDFQNEVHGHPNGIGKLSTHAGADVHSYDYYQMRNNMFVIGSGTGQVSVTNWKIREAGIRQLPIGYIR